MSLESRYIQAQINLLGIHLALAGEIPKRSGDFETTYKTESGKEVAVKRSPDGKFASKNNSGSTSEDPVIIGVDKAIVKSLAKANDELIELPKKVQAEVHELIFNSDFSRGINKTTKSIVDKIDDPNLTAGFNLGQSINDALAKKPFAEFGQTISDKFAEFREELPRKTDNLREEIVRIAKDPNTAEVVAIGVLMGLAGYFHLAGVVSLWRGGAAAFRGFSILPILVAGAISPLEAMTQQVIAISQASGSVIASAFQNTVAAVLASQAGRILLDRAKANARAENDHLKQKILAEKENSDILYQQQLEQQAKATETRKKVLKEVSKDIPKQRVDVNPDKPETLAGLPVLDIKLTDSEESFVADPKHHKQVLAVAYEDEEFLALTFLYIQAQELALTAALSDKVSEQQVIETMEQTKEAISDRLAVVIKAEIKRLQAIEAERPG